MKPGERKIGDAQIADLRERRAQGETLGQLGRGFGYSREGVRQILLATDGDPIPPKTHIGRQFNRLTVISEASRGEDGKLRVLCRCFCGEEKVLKWYSVSSKAIQSCGCQSQHQKVDEEARWLTYQGRTKPLQQWCRELGLKRVTVSARLRHGWPVDEALGTPLHGRYGSAINRTRTHNVRRKLNEWATIGAMAELLMGYNCRQVAERRGVSRGTIETVWYGRRWSELFKEGG